MSTLGVRRGTDGTDSARDARRRGDTADMSSHERRRGRAVLTTLGLFVASLLALYAGGFILFDDRSGFGTDTSGVLLLVALALAAGSLWTGLRTPVARRALGGALALLDATIVAIAASDDGFRFFWTTYEGELVQFEVVVGLVALVLLVPAFRTESVPLAGRAGKVEGNRPTLTAWARGSLYLCALAAGTFVAFLLGAAHFEATQCNEPGGGECDIALLEGVLWAGGALLLGVAVIVVTEIRLALRRRAPRSALR